MRRIKINPKYEHLRSYIESIPDVFEQEGCEIYNKRNLMLTSALLMSWLDNCASEIKFV